MRPILVPGTPAGAGRVRHDLARYGAAIAIAAAFSAVQVFVIPRRLDVATYGQYRLFLLFVNYLGLLQFGIGDGAFMRWAGRPVGAIAWEWRRVGRSMVGIQLAILAATAVASMFVDPLTRLYLIADAVCALFVNSANLSAFALQAVGDFKRAGRVFILAPGLFASAVLVFSPRSLVAIVTAYVGAFMISAAYGFTCLVRISPETPSDAGVVTLRPLILTGLPVLGASIAAGLAQSVDRLLVSLAVPITSFALYGFAATAAVAGNSATQALSRVALSHAARRPIADRARFLGGFLYVIAVAFGMCLILEPLFEHMVAEYLPLYVAALPIVRSFTLGLPVWVALHVVVVGTFQSHGYVRRQLAAEVIGAALVALMSGAMLLAHAPLWQVAAAGSLAAAFTFIIGHALLSVATITAREQPTFLFLGIVAAQGAALIAALMLTATWPMRSATYAAFSLTPSAVAVYKFLQHRRR